ncbi:hypothetical protein F2P81_026307 [Scophthalmus maximus]|uniref:Uncharacterized protein n=1 Tax=Scophthalmus maximus TaxID=52904 RepID=A0A6A4RPZ1_SCOMX|nr:hypothetical protein F2P81_026307 [Scophthalmus maximus]
MTSTRLAASPDVVRHVEHESDDIKATGRGSGKEFGDPDELTRRRTSPLEERLFTTATTGCEAPDPAN